jgi:hypothetical protein
MTHPATWLCCISAMTTITVAAAPGAYTGAKTCQPCHVAEYTSQSASAHAAALSRVAEPHHHFPIGISITRAPRYRYEILGAETALHVHINDGTDVMDLPLEWVFGAGRQASTFVTKVNKDWYVEHYATWYPVVNSYGPTPGQEAVHPKSIAEAAGVLYNLKDPNFGIQGCFECHSTGPVSFDDKGDVTVHERGVRCESCHGPGSDHAADPRGHRMRNPGGLSATALNDFCGNCHRPPAAKNVAIDWNYAWNVRHQPVYLSQSLCFLKSRGVLSCLTCHDPHEPAAKKPVAFFNQKCLECHSDSSRHKNQCLAKSRSNCIDCHMPLVSPQPPLRFTNHWIGIYKTGAKLKPVR